jgi:hypothetical protein
MKKPWPLIARSRLLPVVLDVALRELLRDRRHLDAVADLRAAHTLRRDRKELRELRTRLLEAVVAELAMLFAVTFRSVWAALIPLNAIPNDMEGLSSEILQTGNR